MNRSIIALLVCTVFLLGTHGFEAFGSDSSELNQLLAKGEQGDADAQFELGRMYESGEGVAEHKCEALEWYRQAAMNEHEGSFHNLGSLYSNGEAVACDSAEWQHHIQLIALEGDVQYVWGWMYYIGEGVAEDKQEAAKWWRLAAENGHTYAQFYLGWMYDQGIEIAEDDCEAGRWYAIAAYDGDVDAKANMLMMWYEYNKEGVAIPDCDGLAFLKEEPTF